MTTTLTRHHHVADRTTELVLDELRQSVHSIVLYGSVARGKHTEESDVDILVIADSPTEPDRFSERLCDIETASGALPTATAPYPRGRQLGSSTCVPGSSRTY